ncbi:MAG: hypothetical protein HC840_16895 [Leptolyngbyaceae cyanobacterium RM2_2_4]|nr:hypothetical protein [Leptolyngbyaceae cyanobacterium RM2_2_4]
MYEKTYDKVVKMETIEEFKARGGQVTVCAPTPIKGRYETKRSYVKRTKKVTSIKMEHIPEQFRYLVGGE